MTEKWQPKEWDTETPEQRAERIWTLFLLKRLAGFMVLADEKSTQLVNDKGQVVIDPEGDPTIYS